MDEHLLEGKGAKGVEADKETVEERLEKERNEAHKRKLEELKKQLLEGCRIGTSMFDRGALERRQSFIQNLVTKLYADRVSNLENMCLNREIDANAFVSQLKQYPYRVTCLAYDVAQTLIDSGAL